MFFILLSVLKDRKTSKAFEINVILTTRSVSKLSGLPRGKFGTFPARCVVFSPLSMYIFCNLYFMGKAFVNACMLCGFFRIILFIQRESKDAVCVCEKERASEKKIYTYEICVYRCRYSLN